MERTKRKFITMVTALLVAMMLVSVFPATASAATRSVSESRNVFTSAWEKTKSYDNGKEKMRYGYDTWCQNEDYCRSYVKSSAHSAKVIAGSHSETASGKAGNWSAKADVKHQSGTITWKIMW